MKIKKNERKGLHILQTSLQLLSWGKVFARLFGEAARSRTRSPRRAPQSAKSFFYGAFFLQLCKAKCVFLLFAYMVKEKAFMEFAPFAEKAKRRLLSKRLFWSW